MIMPAHELHVESFSVLVSVDGNAKYICAGCQKFVYPILLLIHVQFIFYFIGAWIKTHCQNLFNVRLICLVALDSYFNRCYVGPYTLFV